MKTEKKYKLISLSLLCLLADRNGLYAISNQDELEIVQETFAKANGNESLKNHPKVQKLEKWLEGKTSNQVAQAVCLLATEIRGLQEEVSTSSQRPRASQEVSSGEVSSTPSRKSLIDRLKRMGGQPVMGGVLEGPRVPLRKINPNANPNANNMEGRMLQGAGGNLNQEEIQAARIAKIQAAKVAELKQKIAERNERPRINVEAKVRENKEEIKKFLESDALASNPKIQAAIGELESGKLPLNKFALLVAAEADAIYKAKRVDRKENEIRDAVKVLVDYAVANGVKLSPDALEAKILGGFGYFKRR
jgi:hypothetical protein